ncbi:hypothetical protein NU08_1910 [Flavobacterium anhuiense]|uniref:Uncharacterized protein n=1 Tax=Flavobacterium anhuiense TaxID=459526 RepID=A0A444W013_9FLAO|nr:hypothetical protein NU08_1910 [Flavobacterium anhuiense]
MVNINSFFFVKVLEPSVHKNRKIITELPIKIGFYNNKNFY